MLSFGPSDDASFAADPWCFVRPALDVLNEHTCAVVIPGWLLLTDEEMNAYRGMIGLNNEHKCPHRSFVKRKPEPLGVEMKGIGCALSGIVLRQEICEGKHRNHVHKFEEPGKPERMQHTTAVTVRLAEPWWGSGRVVAADSWFASVWTAEELGKRGLYFIGDVKTATKRYPKDAITEATGAESGDWATFTSELKLGGDKTMPIFAVSHRRGSSGDDEDKAKGVHKFVCTAGTTLSGNAHVACFEDDEERANGIAYELARKAPRVVNDFTLAQPCIDRHNRYRQFILALEKRFVTNHFNFRFFTTLFGQVVTNAFFAWRYFNDPAADFMALVGVLGYKLMHNEFLEQPASPPRAAAPTAGRATPGDSPDSEGSCSGDHKLVKITSLEGYVKKNDNRLKCNACNKFKTVWCCALCTTSLANIFTVCPESANKHGDVARRSCLSSHYANPNFTMRKRAWAAKRARGRDAGERETVDEEDDEECMDCEEGEEDED